MEEEITTPEVTETVAPPVVEPTPTVVEPTPTIESVSMVVADSRLSDEAIVLGYVRWYKEDAKHSCGTVVSMSSAIAVQFAKMKGPNTLTCTKCGECSTSEFTWADDNTKVGS